jgi:hypothetical protein
MTRRVPRTVPPVIVAVPAAALAAALALTACAAQPATTARSQPPAAPGPSAPRTSGAGPATPSPTTSGPATPVPPRTTSPGAPVAACRDSQVATTLTHTGAATGTVGGFLTFTNRGPGPCTLAGWPTVTAITRAGGRTPVPHATTMMIGHWRYTAPSPVTTLAPGAVAYAALQVTDVTTGDAAMCPPPYTRLEVTIPGGTQPAALSAWLPGAATYLPSCPTVKGGPAIAESDINPPAILPR